jgi:hypothetical protein
VFTESAIRAHRARAIGGKGVAFVGKRDAVFIRALNRRSEFTRVFDQTHHLTGDKITLAALKGFRPGKLAERLPGQHSFQIAGRGHKNGEAMSQ